MLTTSVLYIKPKSFLRQEESLFRGMFGCCYSVFTVFCQETHWSYSVKLVSAAGRQHQPALQFAGLPATTIHSHWPVSQNIVCRLDLFVYATPLLALSTSNTVSTMVFHSSFERKATKSKDNNASSRLRQKKANSVNSHSKPFFVCCFRFHSHGYVNGHKHVSPSSF